MDLPKLQLEKISAIYKGFKQSREVCAFYKGILYKKEDLLSAKLDAEQLSHEIYATVESKKLWQKRT